MKVKEIQCYGDVPREINNWNIPIPTLDYTFIIRLTYQRLVPIPKRFLLTLWKLTPGHSKEKESERYVLQLQRRH